MHLESNCLYVDACEAIVETMAEKRATVQMDSTGVFWSEWFARVESLSVINAESPRSYMK